MGWVWLLRLVCTDGTRFMGSIELGQVGWGGPSSFTGRHNERAGFNVGVDTCPFGYPGKTVER